MKRQAGGHFGTGRNNEKLTPPESVRGGRFGRGKCLDGYGNSATSQELPESACALLLLHVLHAAKKEVSPLDALVPRVGAALWVDDLLKGCRVSK